MIKDRKVTLRSLAFVAFYDKVFLGAVGVLEICLCFLSCPMLRNTLKSVARKLLIDSHQNTNRPNGRFVFFFGMKSGFVI